MVGKFQTNMHTHKCTNGNSSAFTLFDQFCFYTDSSEFQLLRIIQFNLLFIDVFPIQIYTILLTEQLSYFSRITYRKHSVLWAVVLCNISECVMTLRRNMIPPSSGSEEMHCCESYGYRQTTRYNPIESQRTHPRNMEFYFIHSTNDSEQKKCSRYSEDFQPNCSCNFIF